MFNRSLGKSTLADGGNIFSPQTLLSSPEVNGKSMSSYTPLTHARKGTKAYASVEPRHYVGGSSKRELFLNPYHNFANFDRGTKSRPVIRTQPYPVAGDAEPTDRRILKEFRNASMDTNIELDRALGMERLGSRALEVATQEAQNINELRELREGVRRALPTSLNQQLQNTILNSITDNYIRKSTFQQRNPATGTSVTDPIRLATERARQGRSSVDTRTINRAFNESIQPQTSPFRQPQQEQSLGPIVFSRDLLFQDTSQLREPTLVESSQSIDTTQSRGGGRFSQPQEPTRPQSRPIKQSQFRQPRIEDMFDRQAQDIGLSPVKTRRTTSKSNSEETLTIVPQKGKRTRKPKS